MAKKKLHYKSEVQKNAIKRNYAIMKNENTSKRIEAPYPHFRYYKKSKHPALIVGEQPIEEYRFRKVMHDTHDGKRKNEEINPNPNPNDPKPMQIGKRVRHDKKIFFENKPLPWKYPPKN